MAHSSPSSSPPPTPRIRRLRTCGRRIERSCCIIATYFPLGFVYSVTTWGAWVQGSIGLGGRHKSHITGPIWLTSSLGIVLYVLCNISYTIASFKDPGSPLKSTQSKGRGRYSVLPTTESTRDEQNYDTVTVSSMGKSRYCKKCQVPKPDRAHHCSTCKRCVLKMDHHCPWLATCLGLQNYKPFILFISYTSLFCWVCLINCSWWMWLELFDSNQYLNEYAPINIILLAIVSGIFGLVLTGFTAWHWYLVIRGQTTIECLEKTRYLSGVRKRVERNRQDHHNRSNGGDGVAETLQRAGEQILEFHANAVPGASRVEEGEEHSSPVPSIRNGNARHPARDYSRDADTPAQRALRRTYSDFEQEREQDRYEDWLEEDESEKMPNAFNLGWRRNLAHVFGPSPLLWWLPICNTTGDGWQWEVSSAWLQAAQERAQRKAKRAAEVDAVYRRNDDNSRQQIRRGDGPAYETSRDGHVHYASPSDGVSMHTLDQTSYYNRNITNVKQPRHSQTRLRRDFDQAEEGGEIDSFQVSDDDTDTGVGRSFKDDDQDVRNNISRNGFQRQETDGDPTRTGNAGTGDHQPWKDW